MTSDPLLAQEGDTSMGIKNSAASSVGPGGLLMLLLIGLGLLFTGGVANAAPVGAASVVVRGAAAPSAPAAPTATTLRDGWRGGAVLVRWSGADPNGRRITGQTLDVRRNGRHERRVELGGAARSRSLTAKNGAAYTFRVRAENARDPGRWSAWSRPVTPYGKPSAPRDLRATDRDQSAVITWRAPSRLRGTTIDRYVLDGPNGTFETSGTSYTYPFGANDGPYEVTVTPVTKAPDGRTDVTGESASVGGIEPFGTPPTPTASASGGATTVTLSWTGVGDNGRPITGLEVNIDNGGWSSVPNSSGSWTVGNGYNQSHSIQVRSVDSEGQRSQIASASGSSAPQPASAVNVRLEGTSPVGACAANCRWIQVSVVNMRPGTYPVYLDQEGTTRPSDWNGRFTLTVGANGTGSRNNTFYTGFPGRVTVSVNGTRGSS